MTSINDTSLAVFISGCEQRIVCAESRVSCHIGVSASSVKDFIDFLCYER